MMSDAEINDFLTQKMGVQRDYVHDAVAASSAYHKLIVEQDDKVLFMANLCFICESQKPNPSPREKCEAIVETLNQE